MASLLAQVRGILTIDVDSMDPDVAARHNADARFCDMTSNQAIVFGEASRSQRADILRAACEEAKAAGGDQDQQVSAALDLLPVLLAKAVFPHLTGRVHVQTSPSAAYDTAQTVAHASRLVSLFEAHGIPRSRVCIKIPATPESVLACEQLEQQGIRTLATCLFGVPQALAALQAGCLYIAPYFNELRVHFEAGVWKAYDDTVTEHPMALVIASIIKAYKTVGAKTLVMPASIVTAKEVVALASLGPDHLTLSAGVLDQLAAAPVSQELTASLKIDAVLSDTELSIDYLKNGGDALRGALVKDAEATRKLAEALSIFDQKEQQTKALIKEILAA